MDFTGQVIGALGISGPIWRLSNQALQSRAKIVQAAANRLSAEFGAKGRREILLTADSRDCDAFGVDSGRGAPEISSNNKKTSLTFSHTPELEKDVATHLGRRPTMTRYQPTNTVESERRVCRRFRDRISVASVSGQAEKIKIGHLTPLTGFLGALGAYAQLGIRMAEEEINQAGGVMGRPARHHCRKIRSIPPPPRPRRSACWSRTASPC